MDWSNLAGLDVILLDYTDITFFVCEYDPQAFE